MMANIRFIFFSSNVRGQTEPRFGGDSLDPLVGLFVSSLKAISKHYADEYQPIVWQAISQDNCVGDEDWYADFMAYREEPAADEASNNADAEKHVVGSRRKYPVRPS